MNWKDNAFLFTGFKFMSNASMPHLHRPLFASNHTFIFENVNLNLINHYKKDCTLIARKIEDMTDEEVRKCPTFKEKDITPLEEIRYRLMVWTNYHYADMPAVVQNYLLSIGIYPFDQSDFGKLVIDIKETK